MQHKITLKNGESFTIELQPGDYVLDCGANVGDVTDFFQSRGANVIAFEPNDYAYEVLQTRFKNNSKVRCVKKGVSGIKSAGKRKLFLHESASENQIVYSTGSSIIEDKQNVNEEDYIEVEMVDLCGFLKVFKKEVKVLKIDIEGAEVELLNDLLDEELLRDIPYVFVETHEKKIPSLVEGTEKIAKRIIEEKYSNVNLNWI